MSRKRQQRAENQATAMATEQAEELEARDPATVLDDYDFLAREPASSWTDLVATN